MKLFLRSVFQGLVGLLTWVVLTYVVCEVICVYHNARWFRIFFLLLAAALCWITSFRNSRRWERWAYTGILIGAFLITFCWYLLGLLYAICLTCVTVSSFRSESRCGNLFRNQSKLTTRIMTVLYWIWVAILGAVIVPMTIDFYRDFILYI